MRKDFSAKFEHVEYHVHPSLRELPLRADVFLKGRVPQRSRTKLQQVFAERRVLIHGRPVSSSFKLKGGEVVRVLLPEGSDYVEPVSIPLEIVYEDEDILAINKQPGILMHPTGRTLSGTLLNRIHHHYHELGSPIRPILLQRLDRDTSGLVLMAKNPLVHRQLQIQLTRHDLDKVYLALCDGIPDAPEGRVEAPIRKLVREGPSKMEISDTDDARPSLTLYRRLAASARQSLMGILLRTGRQHQIRVHMAHIGHPLVGDILYAGSPDLGRQALHSYFLRFHHPGKGETMELYAPLAADFRSMLGGLAPSDSDSNTVDISNTSRPWSPHTWLDTVRNS